MTAHRLPERSWIFLILLYLFFIYLPLIISRSDSPESFIRGDSYYYRAIIVSLVEDGDLLVANNISADPLDGQLARGTGGLVPKHPILLSILSIPFYLLSGTPGLLLFNLFDCMILMVLLFKLNNLFFDPLISFLTTILYASATLFFDYAYSYSPDIFATVLLIGGLYMVLRDRYYLGAILLGLSIFAKLPNAPLVAVILLYAAFMILRRPAPDGHSTGAAGSKPVLLTTMAALFLIALLPFGYSNYILFGSPLVTGYQRTALASEDGIVVTVEHTAKFNQPLLKGIALSLFHPRNGILPTNPVLLLAFLGVARIRRIQPSTPAFLILLLCLIQFLLFAKYDEWFTSDFSNRFLMTFVALSSIFTSIFLSLLRQRASPESSIPPQTS
jgi:hypothetical protein